MQSDEPMLILLYLALAYGGPFLLGCLFFRLRRARRAALPVSARRRRRAATLFLLGATLLLAYGLGHFKILGYPGAILLSMVPGAPAFFLCAALVRKANTPASEEAR